MNKKGIAILVFIFAGIVFLISQRDKAVDWSQTYLEDETKPFDTKVFNDQLKHWFPKENSKKIYNSFYEYSYDGNLLDSLDAVVKSNYINVSNNFELDKSSLNELLWFVAQGNQAFISADYFSESILDTLGLKIDYYNATIKEQEYKAFTVFTKDSLAYTSKRYYGTSFFKDTTAVTTLGKIQPLGKEAKTNFVLVPFKKGKFYLHTNPEVFTNYQMLQAKNSQYVSTVISYLPKNESFLQQMNAPFSEEKISGSPLRFILAQPSLSWAWYVLLLAIGLFMLFNAKRRQRIIPIIEPLKNTTTEFVYSVSNIHYEAKDFNGIIQKNINYFLEDVRSKYFLNTEKLDQDFVDKLALKSGKPKADIQQLITMVINMKAHVGGTNITLSNLNKQLEKFYQK